MVALGFGAAGLAIDDPVTAYFYLTCGRCKWCRTDRETLCENFAGFVGREVDGGYAEYIKLPASSFLKLPEGRVWITEYPEGALAKAREVYSPTVLRGMESGLVALYWKCPHLGCTVPECVSSQWFECPCHGSKYNQVGEKRGGPAPRGMDRFATSINDRGEFLVDTGKIVQGPPIGTNTTNQEAQGPHCIGEAS